jgi:hypothetical protein
MLLFTSSVTISAVLKFSIPDNIFLVKNNFKGGHAV